MTWESGQWIVRREILNLGKAWCGAMVMVVEDSPDHLATYLPAGTRFEFPPGRWPIEGGRHPWEAQGGVWRGNGTLMVQRPGDSFAAWHFWDGDQRDFSCWYLNLQEPFRRTERGYDTQDLELDIVVFPGNEWLLKDDELLDRRVGEGRFTLDQAVEIRRVGRELTELLDAGGTPWPKDYSDWVPPIGADPAPVSLPEGWADRPSPPRG